VQSVRSIITNLDLGLRHGRPQTYTHMPMSSRSLPNTICSCSTVRTIDKFVWRLLTMSRWL